METEGPKGHQETWGPVMLRLLRYLHGKVPSTLDETQEALAAKEAAECRGRALDDFFDPPVELAWRFDCDYCVDDRVWLGAAGTVCIKADDWPSRLVRVRNHGCLAQFFDECRAMAARAADLYLVLRAGQAEPGSLWHLLPRDVFGLLWSRYILPRLAEGGWRLFVSSLRWPRGTPVRTTRGALPYTPPAVGGAKPGDFSGRNSGTVPPTGPKDKKVAPS
jgi:hypothetical protein